MNEERAPWESRPINLNTREHDVTVEWVMTRLRYSAEQKREIERMAQLAYNHYNSYLDEGKHPWASKAFDPVLFGTLQEQAADVAEAQWASPPIFDFEPEGFTTFEEARNGTALCDYHLNIIKPRRAYNDTVINRHLGGTAFQHFFWNKQLRWRQYWQRVESDETVINPVTGENETFRVQDGSWDWVRKLEPLIDSPDIKDLHLTQVFPDDTVSCVQDGEWFIVRDVISAIDALERVKTAGWDSRAVNRAIKQAMPTRASSGIKDIVDWQTSIGLATGNQKRGLFSEGENGREAVEVIECWRRKEFELERIVILNQAWICWQGPSPYGHALYPFVDTRCHTKSNEFWGMSDYQVQRYMFRTVQTLLNAGVSELMINAMPPILYNSSSIQSTAGWRWEPRALWPVQGDINQIKWFENSGQAFGMARSGIEYLQGRIDNALASGDAQRGGSSSSTARSTASAMNIVAQEAGRRAKYRTDNHSDDLLMPGAELFWALIQQFQNYEVQVRLLGSRAGTPVTLYPEQFRGSRLRALATAASAANKQMKEKRVLDIFDLLCLKAKSPNVNQRNVEELIIETAAPEHKDKIMKSQEQLNQEMQQQMQQQGIPGQMQGNAPMPPQGGAGYNGFQGVPQGDHAAEMAADLAGAMQ